MNSGHTNSVEVKQKTSSSGHGEVVVAIKDVNFSYAPGERQILSGLNMEFRRGQVVAVARQLFSGLLAVNSPHNLAKCYLKAMTLEK
jgi:ABC-type transport system involved in cytochrome bd biosynthesis fused ATPase/permease subunit